VYSHVVADFERSTIAFVMGFTTFLSRCIDYSLIRHDGNLSETIIPHCVAR